MKYKNKLFKIICVGLCCLSIGSISACKNDIQSPDESIGVSESGKEYIEMENGYATKNLEVVESSIKDGALRVDMSKNEGELYIGMDDIQKFNEGDLLAVSLTVYPVQSNREKYSTLNLTYEDGKSFDNAFAVNEWSVSNYETEVHTDGGVKYITLGFDWLKNSTAHIEILSVEKSPLPKILFGGDKLTLLPNTNVGKLQMESFICETDGKLIVVDGGNTGDAKHLYEKILSVHPNKQVNAWFLTHYHSDHITALVELLNNYDITIDKLYYDFPSQEELGDQGDVDNYCIEAVNSAVAKNPNKVVEVVEPKKGDSYNVGNIEVRVLNDACFDKGTNYVNDSSIVYKFVTKGESVLFLGDLGLKGDDYIKDEWFVKEIETCAVVQTAHHGQNGVSDEFYKKCKAMKVCLYCAPYWLYNVDGGSGYGSGTWNTLKTRRLMVELGVLRNYSCASGNDESIL